jgi:hypothetical protein
MHPGEKTISGEKEHIATDDTLAPMHTHFTADVLADLLLICFTQPMSTRLALYQASIKPLLKLHQVSMQASFRLYEGSMKAL